MELILLHSSLGIQWKSKAVEAYKVFRWAGLGFLILNKTGTREAANWSMAVEAYRNLLVYRFYIQCSTQNTLSHEFCTGEKKSVKEKI